MTDHDSTSLGAALRERVHDEDPDLDHLIRVSTRAGVRLRRRRTAGASFAGVAAGVAVIGIVGAALGGSGSTTGTEPGLASQPTATTSSPAVATPKRGQELPVHVDPSLTGWQVGIAGDDKFPASTGDYAMSVNVRSMDEYAAWSGGDPDHPANQVVHIGDNYFVTVQPGPDVPPEVVTELTDALRYNASWARKGARRAQ
jgi:hypothetical protein